MELVTGFLFIIVVVLVTWIAWEEINLWQLRKEIHKIRHDRINRRHEVDIKFTDLEHKITEQEIELKYLRKRIDLRVEAIHDVIKKVSQKGVKA